MPEISRFFGIVIGIYYRDHNPPHFHVNYNEFYAKISIRELKVMEGKLPRRVLAMTLEWAFQNRRALMEDWHLALEKKALKPIKPLE